MGNAFQYPQFYEYQNMEYYNDLINCEKMKCQLTEFNDYSQERHLLFNKTIIQNVS